MKEKVVRAVLAFVAVFLMGYYWSAKTFLEALITSVILVLVLSFISFNSKKAHNKGS